MHTIYDNNDKTQDMFTTIAGTQTGQQTSHGTPITPDTYLGNKCHISLNESSVDDDVYPLLPQLDSDNDTNFTLRTKRNTTSTLNHIDNNAQQTQHEPHSGTNYHDKNQYNNTANTQDTTKSTHARTAPNTNTKSVETETRTIMPNNNTKHMKQIRTQTGHKHNALDQSRETYEISTKISNGLNDMVGEKRM